LTTFVQSSVGSKCHALHAVDLLNDLLTYIRVKNI
jgi:hypothetical protein